MRIAAATMARGEYDLEAITERCVRRLVPVARAITIDTDIAPLPPLLGVAEKWSARSPT